MLLKVARLTFYPLSAHTKNVNPKTIQQQYINKKISQEFDTINCEAWHSPFNSKPIIFIRNHYSSWIFIPILNQWEVRQYLEMGISTPLPIFTQKNMKFSMGNQCQFYKKWEETIVPIPNIYGVRVILLLFYVQQYIYSN